MKIEEKDLKHLNNLAKLLKSNVKFDFNATQVVECYHAFAWLEGLKARMEESLKTQKLQESPQAAETMKDLIQGEVKPLPKSSPKAKRKKK